MRYLLGALLALILSGPVLAQPVNTGHLTAELVSLVDVPVMASGDITSRERAHAILETTGCLD